VLADIYFNVVLCHAITCIVNVVCGSISGARKMTMEEYEYRADVYAGVSGNQY
jgi:hypothetical protein